MERCSYRFARQSDMQMLRSELGEGAWSHLEEKALAGAVALAAPVNSTFHLRSSRLHGGLDGRIDSFRLLQLAIEKAKTLGRR
jgi:hypothetical protein